MVKRGFLYISLILSLFMAGVPAFAQLRCESVFVEASKKDVWKDLSRKLGLRYLESPEAGYTRQRTEQGFIYVDPRGAIVTDPQILSRIDALKIPAVYENVWISMDPRTHLQASGIDSRGRRQYRYHDLWDQVRDLSKFARIHRFGYALPSLRQAVFRDLAQAGLPVSRRLAGVVRLLEVAVIRVGNEEYARENGSYGLTTMLARHVSVQGSQISFSFLGKSGVQHDFSVIDPLVAPLIRDLLAVRGPDDVLFDVTSDKVNDYIKEQTRGAFTAKDFRTWIATVTTAQALHETPLAKDADPTANEDRATQLAANKLRNTPDVCRSSYIHPAIFKAYEDGRLEQAFQQDAVVGYSAAESAVLRVLEAGN